MIPRLRHQVARTGLNRSFAVRQMVRLGSPRLKELDEQAQQSGPRGWALRKLNGWLSSGPLYIPQGLGSGLSMDMRYLPLSHAHVGSIAFGNLEQSVQEAMLRHLPRGGVFYDIGANVGFFVMLAAQMSGVREGRAYAFEPAPDNARAIRDNVALNEIPNVTVIEAAVSDRDGTAQLQVVDDQSWSKLAEYGEHPLTAEVLEVRTVAIDTLVEAGDVQPPTLVKIDVEGAELAVLEGMRRTLEAHAPTIICELHGTHREFVAFCREVGYHVVNLEGPASIEEAGASAHALALPPGRFGD